MKKIVLLVLGLIFLPISAIAYQVTIDAPDTLTVGKPLVVTGTTTFGIGTPIDVVLYHQVTTTTEVKRKIVYIQTDKTFKAVFDTTGLKTGLYKVEVPNAGMGGDSVTMRLIQLIDRSDVIVISSSLTQPFSGKMYVAGTIKGGENSGVQIEVVGPGNAIIFGPRYVNTNYMGDFSVDVPITDNGDYEVSFTDAKGYIGAKTFTILGTPTLADTPVAEITPEVQVLSAHTSSSREQPAYFIVKPGTGPVSVFSSSSVDWVIEYIDGTGVHKTVNIQGVGIAERVELAGTSGKTLYFKMYPQHATISSEAFLYAQNAKSLSVSPDVPAAFAALETPVPSGTQETPVMPLLGLVATGIVALLGKRSE